MPSKPAHRTTQSNPVGPAVEYKVVDTPWSPNDPAPAEEMLNDVGGEGWRLTTVYPSPVREKTRWVCSK